MHRVDQPHLIRRLEGGYFFVAICVALVAWLGGFWLILNPVAFGAALAVGIALLLGLSVTGSNVSIRRGLLAIVAGLGLGLALALTSLVIWDASGLGEVNSGVNRGPTPVDRR
jgi:hypothetical protein